MLEAAWLDLGRYPDQFGEEHLGLDPKCSRELDERGGSGNPLAPLKLPDRRAMKPGEVAERFLAHVRAEPGPGQVEAEPAREPGSFRPRLRVPRSQHPGIPGGQGTFIPPT